MTDWKNMLPEPPPPQTIPSEPAPIEPPSVEPEPIIDNTDPAYWERKATPAEIARAEAFWRAEEKRIERQP
jgi:hypothetical protein